MITNMILSTDRSVLDFFEIAFGLCPRGYVSYIINMLYNVIMLPMLTFTLLYAAR
jgi:hypothetical protein